MGHVIEELAKFIVEIKYEDLPEPVVRETKNLIMDSIGNGLASITTDPAKIFISLAKELGGPPESSIIGTAYKVSCTNAVLANGQLFNALDFDTTVPGGHTPPYIIPTQMAISETSRASGKDLILATALGFEIAARIARATPPGMFYDSENHFRLGPREGYAKANIGAAAGAGKLLKLNQKQMIDALANAGHLSQVLTWTRGNYSPSRNMMKYGVPGWQNTGAIIAVRLAQMGLEGDTELFDDAEHGFGQFCGYTSFNKEKILPGLGETWDFIKVNYKKYACCTMLQAPVEIFSNIIQQNNLHVEDIEAVNILAHPTVDSSLFTSRELNNISDIQFGMHYVIALEAYGYKTGIEWQDWDIVTDPKINEFSKKVSFKGNPDYATDSKSTVEVKAKRKTFRGQIVGNLPKLTDEELVLKYRHNASRALTQNKIEASLKALLELETIPTASDLMTQITL